MASGKILNPENCEFFRNIHCIMMIFRKIAQNQKIKAIFFCVQQKQNPALISEKLDFKLSEPFFFLMGPGFRFMVVWQYYNKGSLQNNCKRIKGLSHTTFFIFFPAATWAWLISTDLWNLYRLLGR